MTAGHFSKKFFLVVEIQDDDDDIVVAHQTNYEEMVHFDIGIFHYCDFIFVLLLLLYRP